MIRGFVLCLVVVCCSGIVGCTACSGPFDDTYSAFGGRWQRDHPASGRVGSVIAPAGTRVDGPPSLSLESEGDVEDRNADGEADDAGQGDAPGSESTGSESPRIAEPGAVQPIGFDEPIQSDTEFDEDGKFAWGFEGFSSGQPELPQTDDQPDP